MRAPGGHAEVASGQARSRPELLPPDPHRQSAPESESGALIDGLFPPSPHKWPNQPWTAPEVPGGHVDSKLLAGCYLWFKRALAARTDSGCELNWPRMVSDGAGQSNLCPQLCPVVGMGPKVGKTASRNWLLRLAFRHVGATGFEPATS